MILKTRIIYRKMSNCFKKIGIMSGYEKIILIFHRFALIKIFFQLFCIFSVLSEIQTFYSTWIFDVNTVSLR